MTLKDPCPLGCERSWHGLPKPATTYPTRVACPGPWGGPVPVEEEADDAA